MGRPGNDPEGVGGAEALDPEAGGRGQDGFGVAEEDQAVGASQSARRSRNESAAVLDR